MNIDEKTGKVYSGTRRSKHEVATIEHLEINGSEQFNIAIDVSKVPEGIPMANIIDICKTIVSETGSLPDYATYIEPYKILLTKLHSI